MTGYEYRRFPEGQSPVSTFGFHEHRERAPHLEQQTHQARMQMAYGFVHQYVTEIWPTIRAPRERPQVVDLGCGDGGLLQLLDQDWSTEFAVDAHGYDFQPTNVIGWDERHVEAEALDFVGRWDLVEDADLYVLTEVLEHLEDPHQMLRNIRDRGATLICSSPWMEHEGSIDACHAWAWDIPGYIAMLEGAGFRIVRSEQATWSQVHLAVPDGV